MSSGLGKQMAHTDGLHLVFKYNMKMLDGIGIMWSMCISWQPVIQGTRGPDRLQGERAGCPTRHSDTLITDPRQSPGSGQAKGGRRRTSGLSPSTQALDVGFTGAQAVPSSASPLDPLSRKPHPSPGLQTGSLRRCLVSKPRLTASRHWAGPLWSLTGSSHLACPGWAVCPFLPFL